MEELVRREQGWAGRSDWGWAGHRAAVAEEGTAEEGMTVADVGRMSL